MSDKSVQCLLAPSMATIKQLKEFCNKVKDIDASIGYYAADTLEIINNGTTSISKITARIQQSGNKEALKIHNAVINILNT